MGKGERGVQNNAKTTAKLPGEITGCYTRPTTS